MTKIVPDPTYHKLQEKIDSYPRRHREPKQGPVLAAPSDKVPGQGIGSDHEDVRSGAGKGAHVDTDPTGRLTVNDFTKGERVKYIPTRAKGDVNHPDCKIGHVTSKGMKFVFVRFKGFASKACYPEKLVKWP